MTTEGKCYVDSFKDKGRGPESSNIRNAALEVGKDNEMRLFSWSHWREHSFANTLISSQ